MTTPTLAVLASSRGDAGDENTSRADHRRLKGHGRSLCPRARRPRLPPSLSLLARSADVEPLARELGGRATLGNVDSAEDWSASSRKRSTPTAASTRSSTTPATRQGRLLEISDQDWHSGLDMLVLNVVRVARLVTPVMEGRRDRQRRPSRRSSPIRASDLAAARGLGSFCSCTRRAKRRTASA